MKKSWSRFLRMGVLITAFCALALHSASGLPGENSTTETERRVPGNAIFHIRVSGASELSELLGLYVSHAVSGVDDPLPGLLAGMKKQSGIDVLNVNSLKKAGIQTDGPLSLSAYQVGDSRNYLLIVPVTGGKSFPNTFTKIIQRVNKGRDLDLDPVITRYNRFAAYQILNDIFYTADDDYFILSSSGALLKQAMDLSAGEKSTASLADDPEFSRLLSCAGTSGDMLVFTRKGLPWNIFVRDQRDAPATEAGDVASDISFSGAVISSRSDSLDATVLLSFSDTPSGKNMLNALKPVKDAVYPLLDEANFSAFLALNVTSLYDYCDNGGKNGTLCPVIRPCLAFLDNILGLNISGGLLPLSGGMVSLQTARTKEPGKSDSILLYASKDPAVPASGITRAIREELKGGDGESRGTKTLGEDEWFWKLDQQGNRVYIFGGETGLFIVNNTALASGVLAEKRHGMKELRGDFAGDRENIFFLTKLNVRDESFIKTILLLSIYNSHRRLFNIAGLLDTVTMAGSVKDCAVIIDLRATLAPAGKK